MDISAVRDVAVGISLYQPYLEAAGDNADTEQGWPRADRVPAGETRRSREQHPRMDPMIRLCCCREEGLIEASVGGGYGYPEQQLDVEVQKYPALVDSATLRQTIQHGQGVPPSYLLELLA